MLWHIYLRDGEVFVPTVAKTDAGFFVDIEPVVVLKSNEPMGVMAAVVAVINNGNPSVETPSRAAFPKPAVLSHAKVKTWAAFEKKANFWKVTKNGSEFQLKPQRKSSGHGWEDVPGKSESFVGDGALEKLASSLALMIERTE